MGIRRVTKIQKEGKTSVAKIAKLQPRPERKKVDDLKIALLKIKGMTAKEIAKLVGVSDTTVFTAMQRVRANPELAEALELNNYGLRTAVKKMVEMTDALEVKYFSEAGVVTDKRIVADNSTRFNARKFMLQVHGAGTNDDAEPRGTGGGNNAPQVVINLGFLNTERARAVSGMEPGGDGLRGPDLVDAQVDEDSRRAGQRKPVQATS